MLHGSLGRESSLARLRSLRAGLIAALGPGLVSQDEVRASSCVEGARSQEADMGDQDHWPSIWREGLGPLQLSLSPATV